MDHFNAPEGAKVRRLALDGQMGRVSDVPTLAAGATPPLLVVYLLPGDTRWCIHIMQSFEYSSSEKPV